MQERTLFRIALATSLLGVVALFFITTVLSLQLQLDGPYVVTYVVDGDTLDLDTGERIRLSGINAPESGECGYDNATLALKALVLDKEVYLERDYSDTGKYGRMLRYIYVDDAMVNLQLVVEGYVKVYDKYASDTKRYDQLKAAEAVANASLLSVWTCVDLKADCLYVASKNSKIYHEPHCKWAKKIKEGNLICFKEGDSLEGYEPAKSC
jgi:endonuclease YncB( thermonuclease family)